MKLLTAVPNLVMWHDGMALCPQHLQQGFSRTEGLIQYYQSNFLPFPYGVIKLSIDDSILASGVFKISELEVIFPDGFAYSYDSSTDSSLELDLNEYKSDFEKSNNIRINIAIPVQSSRSNILNTNTSRFKTVTSEAAFDEVTGQNDILIPRLRPNVRLELEHISNIDTVTVPLAVLMFDNEMFKKKIYEPPALSITKNMPTWNLCVSVIKKIRYKIQTLIEDVQKVKKVSYETYMFDRYFFLRNLNESLLRFEVTLFSEKMHPFLLFVEFVSLYSKIISTDLDLVPPSPPSYDHNSILVAFEKVKTAVEEFMEREAPSDYNVFRLNKIDKRYEYTLDENMIFDGNHLLLGLKRPVEVSKENFRSWVQSLLICQDKNFATQYNRRTLGFAREIIDRYGNLLPQRNMFLVRIALESNFPKNGTISISPIIGTDADIVPEDVVIYGKRT